MPNLTQAWTRAEADKPLGWKLCGMVLGRRATWVAWARGPNGDRAEGKGDNPQQALSDLANKLDRLRGDPNR